ncbi:MAG: hypothetical protein ACLQU2_07205 [Candidatus Binataceae bacterium]
MADLRRAVCVAEQDPFILMARCSTIFVTAAWNTLRPRIQEAVMLAGLEAYVVTMPRGLDTYLAKFGRNLSGG